MSRGLDYLPIDLFLALIAPINERAIDCLDEHRAHGYEEQLLYVV